MANLFLRSPRTFSAIGTTGWNSAKLKITIGGVVVYTLIENRVTASPVYFEVSELIRDYLEPAYANPIDTSKESVVVGISTEIFNGLNAEAGTSQGSPSGFDFFAIDGYGYFEDGGNPTTTRGYMQSNTTIQRLEGDTLRIPFDRNNVTAIVLYKNNAVVLASTFTSSTTECFKYFEYALSNVDELRYNTNGVVKSIKLLNIEECKFKPHKITFRNRFGGLQDLYFFKKSTESLATTRETFKASSAVPSGLYDVRAHQKKTFNLQSNKKVSLNSGFVSEDYNDPMQELLQSEQVWMEVDSIVTPMIVTDSSLTFKTSVNDKLVDYKLELDYAFDAINDIR
jgi:hypothetical protein